MSGGFQKNGWYSVPEADVEDVVMCVFESLVKQLESFELDSAKGRFRQFLTSVCQRRVVDFLRNHKSPAYPYVGAGPTFDTRHQEEQAAKEDFDDREEKAFRKALLGILLAALHYEVSPQVYLIFESVKLNGKEPSDVAARLKIRRGVIDNSIYKAMEKLREIAQRPDFVREYESGSSRIKDLASDDKYSCLRQAHQELEEFQTSEKHKEAKMGLREKSDTGKERHGKKKQL